MYDNKAASTSPGSPSKVPSSHSTAVSSMVSIDDGAAAGTRRRRAARPGRGEDERVTRLDHGAAILLVLPSLLHENWLSLWAFRKNITAGFVVKFLMLTR